MRCEVGGMSDINPRVSDTLPRRGRVTEVCREWVVHEDEALAYQLQKQEVEQHYGNNKERNARVREDFPKAKEEQEREIAEAAEKYRQMVRQQEKVDSTYARRVAEKLERDELEKRKRAEIRDLEVAKQMQVFDVAARKESFNGGEHRVTSNKGIPVALPDVNRIGLPLLLPSPPLLENANFEPVASVGRQRANLAVTHSLRNLRLIDDNESHLLGMAVAENMEPCTSAYVAPPTTTSFQRVNRTPTSATLLPEDLNEIVTDVDLREEANKRLQEEKDAELARMLQKQEEEILNEEIDRDRMLAIEAQDKELAKLLFEKEKAKLKRAKERAKQRALLKKQQQQEQRPSTDEKPNGVGDIEDANGGVQSISPPRPTVLDPSSPRHPEPRWRDTNEPFHSTEETDEDQGSRTGTPFRTCTSAGGRTTAPSLTNVAMHIDPTYLSQQSSSTPNSLLFQDGDGTAPPYMPIQGQRRNSPFVDKKQKKPKSKDGGCKQQ